MNVYITLDYELFLSSKTGTVDNCLIKPTAELLKTLDLAGVKATFFVDAAYLIRLSRVPELKTDYAKVSEHIKRLSMSGHSIQLHFHPQWLYSTYRDGKWQMDMEHYKLSDMSYGDVERNLAEACRLLQSLSGRQVTTFRAGGYSIMDFERYKDLFGKIGIRKDTSVLRGKVCASRFQQYDYHEVPALSSYPFSKDIVKVDPTGSFIEYPIATKKAIALISTIKTYLTLKRARGTAKKWGDGKSVGTENKNSSWIKSHWHLLVGSVFETASIDSLGNSLKDVYKYSCSHYQGNDFVIIGHPKNITPFSLNNLTAFINEVGADSFRVME